MSSSRRQSSEKQVPESRGGGLYYGWVIVGVMALAGAMTMAMGSLNYGLFIKPMGDDLGIGRSTFGWGQTVRQVASAATSPIVGGLLDRFGARVLLAVASMVTGVALMAVGGISQGWQLIALLALAGAVGMSGPGAMVTTVPVAKWFVRQRGKAMAWMSIGIPVGGVVFVPLTQIMIDSLGWRATWVILGVISTGIIVPVALLLVRREPEDMGLRPDGDGPAPVASDLPKQAASRAPSNEEYSWTRREAIRSPTFWRLTIAFSVVMLVTSSMAVHRIPYFMDQGLAPQLVSYATALDAASAGVSMFLLGMLADRVPARYLAVGCATILTLATALTVAAEGAPLMFVSMSIFGMGAGGLLLTQNYLWAAYFGRRNLGSIPGAS